MIRFARYQLFASCLTMAMGCTGDALTDVIPQRVASEEAFWSLSANYRAVNLALTPPYNTVQLRVTPYNARGDSIPFDGVQPVYSALDTTRVQVTQDGILTAKATGNNIVVRASLQIGGITHVDTILVKVTPSAPVSPLATFSVQPGIGDSAAWSWGGESGKLVRPVARSAANGTVRLLQVHWSVSDSRIARIASSGITDALLTGTSAGRVWVRASVYAYGVFLQDSVEYLIGYPIQQIINVDRITYPDGSSGVAFYPANVTIGVGGMVIWDYRGQWKGVQSPGLVFDQPEAARAPTDCGVGTGEVCRDPMLFDLMLLDARNGNAEPRRIYTEEFGVGAATATLTLRMWLEPGVYTFQDHWGQRTGTIVVKDRTDL